MDFGILMGDRFRLGAHSRRSREGEIHEATDQRTDSACEVEVVFASGFRLDEVEERFQREVAVGAQLEGAGFLRALGFGRLENGRLFVARERGVDARPLPLGSGDLEQRVWRVLSAARRVEELAAQGAVHRDLGPLTLLEDSTDEVLLTGFALAKLEGLEEPPLDLRGLPVSWLPCSSPELLRAPDEVDARSDVYALGALLFMTLAQRWPYLGPTLHDLLAQQDAVRRGDSSPPLPQKIDPEIPDALSVICAKALALDSVSRTGSASEFAEQLEDYLAVRASGVFSKLPTGSDPSDRLPVAVPLDSEGDAAASSPAFFPTGRTVPTPHTPAPPEGVSLIPTLIPHPKPRARAILPGGAWGDPARGSPRAGETLPLKVELPAEAALPHGDVEAGFTPARPLTTCAGAGAGTPPSYGRDQSPEATPPETEEDDDEVTEPIDVEMPPGEADHLGSLEEARSSATGTEVFEVAPPPPGLEANSVGHETADLTVELPPGESGLHPKASASDVNLLEEALATDPTEIVSAQTERMSAVAEEDLLEGQDEEEELSPEEAAAMISAKSGAPSSMADDLVSRKLFDPFASDEHPALPQAPGAHSPPPKASESEEAPLGGDLPAPPPSLPDLPAPPAVELRAQQGEPSEPERPEAQLVSDSDLELDPLLDSGDRARLAPSAPAQTPPAVTQHLGALDLTEATADDSPSSAKAAPPLSATAPPPAPSALPELPEEEEIELLPPVAFDALRAYEGGVLVLSMPKDFEAAVADVRHLNADGFDHLVLDMHGVAFLGGSQLEALTELVSLAARRELETVMFGLKPDLRQLLLIMDMGDVLPAALAAHDIEGAVREIVQGADAP